MKNQNGWSRTMTMALVVAAFTLPAAAETQDDTAVLRTRLAADQSELDALAAKLSAAGAPAKNVQVADLFGPSDEEKAAAAAAAMREQQQDAGLAALNQRAGQIEDSIRQLTGQIEVLNHRLDEIDRRIDSVKKEFDFKLCSLSAQQLGASAQPGTPDAVPCNGAAPASPGGADAQPSSDTPPSGVTRLAPGPGVLGTLPQNPAMPEPQAAPPPQSEPQTAPPPAGAQPTVTASVDPHAAFEAAMNLLAKSQYDEASGAFRTFADANPKDPQAPMALFWVGDIAYVQKDYANAAHAFLDVLKKYPTSARAADSMLKLGQSLIAMNQKQEGCTTLRALPTRYPQASKTVLSEAEAVRKAGGCRH